MPALRLRGARAGEQVGGRYEAAVNLIRDTRLHGLKRQIGMRVQHHAHVGRVLLQSDDLVLKLRPQLLPAKPQITQRVVHITQKLPTRNVQVAGDGLKRQHTLARLSAVGLLVGRQTPQDGGVGGVGVHTRGTVDIVHVKAADLGRSLSRHGSHALGQLLEAIAEAVDKVVVVEVFGDDDVEHGHAQRRVGARAQR